MTRIEKDIALLTAEKLLATLELDEELAKAIYAIRCASIDK